MQMKQILPASLFVFLGIFSFGAGDPDFTSWSLEKAAGILNRSPWSKQETITQVVGGIGSGIQGEKEIYNTYFVRLLSARPVREAYARIRQIQLGYDQLSAAKKAEVDTDLARLLDLDVENWIVVGVAFRSNNPRQQSSIERFLESETTQTIRNRAYLATKRHPRVLLEAYFPPRDWMVGAKFVFPRYLNGEPVVSPDDKEFVFEFDTPVSGPELRVSYSVAELKWENGGLEF
jgi:hypothetical protein